MCMWKYKLILFRYFTDFTENMYKNICNSTIGIYIDCIQEREQRNLQMKTTGVHSRDLLNTWRLLNGSS